MSRNLLLRIAFAAVALPVALWVIYQGGWVLALLLAVLGMRGTWEVYALAQRQGIRPLTELGLLGAAALPVLGYLGLPATALGVQCFYCGSDASLLLSLGAVWVLSVFGAALRVRAPSDRRAGRGGGRRVRLPCAPSRAGRAVPLRPRAHAGRRRRGVVRTSGRRGGVAAQAGSRRERLLGPDPRPRRPARSPRLAVLRDPGDGAALHRLPAVTVGVAVLGSTGSIGCSTLQVLARQRQRFRVVALTGHSNKELLARQAAEWQPSYVGLVNGGSGGVGSGRSCLVEAATHPDARIVVNGIVGAAGLEATLAALRAGKRGALANKETLVMAGDLVTRAAREGGGEVGPVDSQHSAVRQCLNGPRPTELARLILTASGGPFRTWSAERAGEATVAEALQHPTWKMGRKITVDSATLVNKALEVIEAHFLFVV